MSGGDLLPCWLFLACSLMGGGLLVFGSGWLVRRKSVVVGRDGWVVCRARCRPARRLVSSFNVRSRRGKKCLLVLFSFVAASK